LNGDFALVHIRSRRSGSKGTEWLLIKKHDEHEVQGYDIEQYDTSVLTKRTLAQIAGDQASAEWTSSPPTSRGRLKAPWLAETLAKLDKKKRKKINAEDTESAEEKRKKSGRPRTAVVKHKNSSVASASSAFESLAGAVRAPWPKAIHPMLATSVEKPFDDPDWLFEIKWDGYRAIAFVESGKLRLVSRSQNDLTAQFAELHDLPRFIKAKTAILDGEVVALDEQGRPSFSLMQQRTGIRRGGRRVAGRADVSVLYYAFDLLYADGFDLRRVSLEQRKQALEQLIVLGDLMRYSDHYAEQGMALFEVARQKGLEGILAKRRSSLYEERRSSQWLKIKITKTIDCVIGGYTDPEGTREHFGSIVLGLYDKKGNLIHIGQAGTGFDHRMLKEIYQLLHERETKVKPFHGEVEALRPAHWVKPELVAEIKFSEWTHETAEGGLKLRAPVFLGLREDKEPRECTFEESF
jgi:bifunctional non-homologous end joining protein LigD